MRRLAASCCTLVACGGPLEETPISFEDVTTASGISMRTTCGGGDPTQLMEVNGSGLALLDIDGDGDLDLFVANGATMDDTESGPGWRMYANESSPQTIKFLDVTDRAGVALTRWAHAVGVGDANGDGFEDLHVTCAGSNVLLVGDGIGHFVDATDAAGLGDLRWGTSARFGDLDGDGDLDLVVTNYVDFDADAPPPRARYKGHVVYGGPHGMPAQPDVVYEHGDDHVFREVSDAWGFTTAAAHGLNAVILDFTGDGAPDVLVANDSMANELFVSDGNSPPTFEADGMASGIAASGDGSMQATMGIAIADVNGDGFPDAFTTNFSSDTNTLHVSDGGRFFDDRTQALGLGLPSRPLLGWSCGFFDLDHDGDEDLLAVNGHVYGQATPQSMDSAFAQPLLVMARRGDRFVRLAGAPMSEPHVDRAAVFGDLDGDSDIDLVIAEREGPLRILRNLAIERGRPRGLVVMLRQEGANATALGAVVRLKRGATTLATRWMHDGAGFQSSTTPFAHFGQVPAGSMLEITWPDGHVLRAAPGRGHQVIRRGAD